MTAFPTTGSFDVPATESDYTGADAAADLADLLDASLEFPGAVAVSELTIATGNIVPTGGAHSVDTEASAATDDLDHVQSTNVRDGALVVLYEEDLTRVVTCKHMAGGAGQMSLAGAADYLLGTGPIMLQRKGSIWHEVCRAHDAATEATQTADLATLKWFVSMLAGGLDGVFAFLASPGTASLDVVATSAETMAVVVKEGAGIVDGEPFQRATGGNSSAMSAPTVNPRIDAIAVDSTDGSIVIHTGIEAASPVAPDVDSGELLLAWVNHVVGESAIYDAATSGEGDIEDQRSWLNV